MRLASKVLKVALPLWDSDDDVGDVGDSVVGEQGKSAAVPSSN